MPFVKHPLLALPENSQILWRYLDFPKFVSLVQQKAMFFPWINKLKDDPWEGRSSKLNFDENRIISVRFVDGKDNPLEHRKLKDILNKPGEIEEHKLAHLRMSRMFFINCWHMNDGESDSQWKIYGTSPFSMVIISSFSLLSSAIIDDKEIYGSRVSYYDPNIETTAEGNAFFLATHKRNAFIHEREFRLIFFDPSIIKTLEDPRGISVAVDLKILIQKVVISPIAPQWFVTEVKTFMQTHGLNMDCVQSELLNTW